MKDANVLDGENVIASVAFVASAVEAIGYPMIGNMVALYTVVVVENALNVDAVALAHLVLPVPINIDNHHKFGFSFMF